MLISPSTKLTAAIGVALLIAAGAMRVQRDAARTALSDYRAQVAEATARAQAQARAQETAMRGQAEQMRDALEKETKHAQDAQARLLAGIRSGTQRLSIAAHCPTPAGLAPADPAAAPGTAGTARAELDPTAAEALVSIAAEGDAAIRERNACITLYNSARDTLNGD